MASGVRYVSPFSYEPDENGVPEAGSQLFFYQSGTSILQNTYQDIGLTTPNVNPVIADANGRFGNVFLNPSTPYGVQFWTAPTPDNPTGSQVWSADPYGGAGTAGTSGGLGTIGIIGECRAFAGPSNQIPAGWYQAYGQAVSRTTYSSGFAVLGTTWGAGDGSTTFNLPDLRSRSIFGLDNMGGTAANRLTAGISGISANTLGATGGDQNVPEHTHNYTDPGHTHTINDPQHYHSAGNGSSGFLEFIFSGGLVNVTSGSPEQVNAFQNTQPASTGITINSATIGITVEASPNVGTGANVPPAAVMYWIIYLGA